MKVIQIVGYKNSGKTTLVSDLIRRFTRAGYRVGSLKHHGHGGKPDVIAHKDSDLHQQAGSVVSGVEGDGQFLLSMNQSHWSLRELIERYEGFDLDILLIEGYKYASYPKIVLVRNEADLSLLDELESIIGVVSSCPIPQQHTFQWGEEDSLFEWLLKFIDIDMTGLVIAGGKSRRYGRPKAFETIGGQYFYEKSLYVLGNFCDRSILITNEQLKNRFQSDIPVFVDSEKYQNYGPLAGLYTGMKNSDADWYATLPVDVPNITASVFMELLKGITDQAQAIVPVTDGQKQPLVALYHHSVYEAIEALLNSGQSSLHQLLDRIHTVYLEMEDADPFLNVNYLSDHPDA